VAAVRLESSMSKRMILPPRKSDFELAPTFKFVRTNLVREALTLVSVKGNRPRTELYVHSRECTVSIDAAED
jgi:hypothetical protein